MPKYRYSAIDCNGQKVKDTLEATDETALEEILQAKGCYLLEATQLTKEVINAAKLCAECGKKLSFFTREPLCKECKTTYEAEFCRIELEILATKNVTRQQLEILGKQNKKSLIRFYDRIYESFESDKELEEEEIETLQKLQEVFDLTNEDVRFDERIRPYFYINKIRKEGILPVANLSIEGGSLVIFRKDEIVHFADDAILKELRSVNLGYSRGSRGISFRIAKGVRFRVGAHRGRVVKEDRFIETSRGTLLITNQRLFLHPFPGHKPLNIPLKKVLTYQCFNNGIELYKDGREKSYFFEVYNSGSVEIFNLCLGHLLGQ